MGGTVAGVAVLLPVVSGLSVACQAAEWSAADFHTLQPLGFAALLQCHCP